MGASGLMLTIDFLPEVPRAASGKHRYFIQSNDTCGCGRLESGAALFYVD